MNNPSQNLLGLCWMEIVKRITEWKWKCKGTRMVQIVLNMRRVGGLTFADFKTYCISTVNQTERYFRKGSHIYRMEQTKKPKNVLRAYNQQIFVTNTKVTHRGKDCLFNRFCSKKMDKHRNENNPRYFTSRHSQELPWNGT